MQSVSVAYNNLSAQPIYPQSPQFDLCQQTVSERPTTAIAQLLSDVREVTHSASRQATSSTPIARE